MCRIREGFCVCRVRRNDSRCVGETNMAAGGIKEFQTNVTDAFSYLKELATADKSGSLVIVDAHSHWAGPCKAAQPVLQRLYMDYIDDNPKFLTADADRIVETFGSREGFPEDGVSSLPMDDFVTKGGESFVEDLKNQCGRSKPMFLFYNNGHKVGQIDGLHTPKLNSLMKEQMELNAKHKKHEGSKPAAPKPAEQKPPKIEEPAAAPLKPAEPAAEKQQPPKAEEKPSEPEGKAEEENAEEEESGAVANDAEQEGETAASEAEEQSAETEQPAEEEEEQPAADEDSGNAGEEADEEEPAAAEDEEQAPAEEEEQPAEEEAEAEAE